MECIELAGGIAVPVSALSLAWSLENRGYTLVATEDSLRLRPAADGSSPALTDEDRAEVRRWKSHLLMLAAYEAPSRSVSRRVSRCAT